MDQKKVLNLIREIIQSQINTHRALAATHQAIVIWQNDKARAQDSFRDLGEYLNENVIGIQKSLEILIKLVQEVADAE